MLDKEESEGESEPDKEKGGGGSGPARTGKMMPWVRWVKSGDGPAPAGQAGPTTPRLGGRSPARAARRLQGQKGMGGGGKNG